MAELTPDQKRVVADWIKAGSSLADVQKKLREELGVSLTYMDVRLLVLDLGVKVKDKPTPKAPPPAVAGQKGQPAAGQPEPEEWEEEASDAPAPGMGGAGRVSVSVDRIVKPGALVSGSVTFGDGVSMGWSLDQFGRLALSGGKPGYKPSQQDVMAFQSELRRLLEQKGF